MMAPPDTYALSSSRTSSLAGKKRPRESDWDGKPVQASRRTRSVGDARDLRGKDKDREAFQRGLIAVFVPNALRESLDGNTIHYNDLLTHFLPSPTVPVPALPPLLPLLRGLYAHVNLLAPDVHGPLVTAILALPWATGDEKFVKVFVGFAGVLVSAHPSWAKEVMNMAVRGLAWQQPISQNPTTTITRRMYHGRHHLLISHLLSLIPTLPTVLQPLLSRQFPHKRESSVAQTTWVRNCCKLIGYCPELGQRIWGMVVDRMLRIDVEITNILEQQEDDEDETEDEDEESVAGPSQPSTHIEPFDLLISQDMSRGGPSPYTSDDEDDEDDIDPDDVSSADGEASEDDVPEDQIKAAKEKANRKIIVKSMRDKLDGMMLYFFEHLEDYMGGRSVHNSAGEMATFRMASIATDSGASTPTFESPASASPSLPVLSPRRSSPTPAQSLSHFQTLLNLFTRQILPTASTQHIPFLLFLTSSLSPAHIDLFLGLLVSQALYGTSTVSATSSSQPVSLTQRVASTVYIGSIVCRARHVNDDQARQVLTYLLAYLEGKMQQSIPDELQLFYAVCQAVLLIFCFRWRAFLQEKDDNVLGDMEMDGEGDGAGEGKWMRDLDVLQRALTSDLNPLLGCNPTIVSTFAKVAHQTHFAYCFSIIEANQQQSNAHTRIPTQSSSSTPGTQPTSRQNSMSSSIASLTLPTKHRQANIDAGLDNYFPFDPYDLPRSKNFVERLYRTWGEVAVEAADSDSEDEDEEEEESEADSDELSDDQPFRGMPKAFASSGSYSERRKEMFRNSGLSSSLEGMSISPGFSRMVG